MRVGPEDVLCLKADAEEVRMDVGLYGTESARPVDRCEEAPALAGTERAKGNRCSGRPARGWTAAR